MKYYYCPIGKKRVETTLDTLDKSIACPCGCGHTLEGMFYLSSCSGVTNAIKLADRGATIPSNWQ